MLNLLKRKGSPFQVQLAFQTENRFSPVYSSEDRCRVYVKFNKQNDNLTVQQLFEDNSSDQSFNARLIIYLIIYLVIGNLIIKNMICGNKKRRFF